MLLLASLLIYCGKFDGSCMKCVYPKECGFCRSTKKCLDMNSTEYQECEVKVPKKDEECVHELLGDAVYKTRVFIGIMIVAFVVTCDLIIRFCDNKRTEGFAQIR